MPTSPELHSLLATIAREAFGIGVLWHVLVAAGLVAVALGVRVSDRTGAAFVTVPLLSVGVVALFFGNPFNAIVYGLVGIALFGCAQRASRERAAPATGAPLIAGGLLLAFGWVYPHFFERGSLALYALGSPIGVLPCPTLAVTMGLTLIGSGFGSRPFSALLGSLGAFYGLFGVFVLDVTIDAALLAGAALLFANLRSGRQAADAGIDGAIS
jgi:hypothetical protein